MRKIRVVGSVRRDLKSELHGRHGAVVRAELDPLVERLARDQVIDERHRDHPPTGNWTDHRDLHVRPDLVLTYRKVDDELLPVRLGSHGELRL